MDDLLNFEALKEGGYFALLVALLGVIYRAGKAVGNHVFSRDDTNPGLAVMVVKKAVNTLDQVQTSVAEQSAASTKHARAAAITAKAQKKLVERVNKIEGMLVTCQTVHPPRKPRVNPPDPPGTT
jgi:hypothetical protein